MSDLYDMTAPLLDGTPGTLSRFRGDVLLIVNVASRCGFTPQYAGLDALYRRYRDQGFSVLGFPCNQFGHQEPGDAAAIKAVCSASYGVAFPVFAKIEVNGPRAHPLYRLLKAARPGLLGSRAIKWNFTKFLVDRNGAVVDRFGPATTPTKLTAPIESLLRQPAQS